MARSRGSRPGRCGGFQASSPVTGRPVVLLLLVSTVAALSGGSRFRDGIPAYRSIVERRGHPDEPGLLGYPAPAGTAPHPTATPAPDRDGRYPPPAGMPHHLVALEDSPFSPELRWLQACLDRGDVGALTAAIGSSREGLLLERYAETEGSGARPAAETVGAALEALFEGGSRPVVQGLFSGGCIPRRQPCTLMVVTTGWHGDMPMPTRAPEEPYGPAPPPMAPLGAAAWEIAQDGAGGLRWRAWWLGDGYYELVSDLAVRELGAYTVLRDGN